MSNRNLVALMDEARYSVTELARDVCRFTQTPGYVTHSAVSRWRNHGAIPHGRLPYIVAHLLSNRIRRSVEVRDLWGHDIRPQADFNVVYADDGMDRPWCLDSTITLHKDWEANNEVKMDVDRRDMLAVWGPAATATIWPYLDEDGKTSVRSLGDTLSSGKRVGESVLHALGEYLHQLRLIDDQESGNPHFAHNLFLTLGNLLATGKAETSDVTQRLLSLYAQAGQLAGWIAFEDERHGAAQRYFRTALRAAKEAGDRPLGAYVLSCLAYQAAYCGHVPDAVSLGEAALYNSVYFSPAAQAMILHRRGIACAVSGDEAGVRRYSDESVNALESTTVEQEPRWVYWLNRNALQAANAYAALYSVEAASRHRERLFSDVEVWMLPIVEDESDRWPRDITYYASRRAIGNLWKDVAYALDLAIAGLDSVTHVGYHPRSVTQLRRFDRMLGQHPKLKRHKGVKHFRDRLRAEVGV